MEQEVHKRQQEAKGYDQIAIDKEYEDSVNDCEEEYEEMLQNLRWIRWRREEGDNRPDEFFTRPSSPKISARPSRHTDRKDAKQFGSTQFRGTSDFQGTKSTSRDARQPFQRDVGPALGAVGGAIGTTLGLASSLMSFTNRFQPQK